MADTRNERLARNEARFRDLNEALDDPAERRAAGGLLEFCCECADNACTALVRLTSPEYEAVRSHPTRFFIVQGHDYPEVERVVEEHDRYVVVEKHEDVRPIVKASDPRSHPLQ